MRIGINVEDVIVDEDKLLGNGVNVASRVHQLAAPDEIVVTKAVRDLVLNKLPVEWHDLGEQKLKNSASRFVPIVRSYRPGRWLHAPAIQPHLMWESRPTIAVLPFLSEPANATAISARE